MTTVVEGSMRARSLTGLFSEATEPSRNDPNKEVEVAELGMYFPVYIDRFLTIF